MIVILPLKPYKFQFCKLHFTPFLLIPFVFFRVFTFFIIFIMTLILHPDLLDSYCTYIICKTHLKQVVLLLQQQRITFLFSFLSTCIISLIIKWECLVTVVWKCNMRDWKISAEWKCFYEVYFFLLWLLMFGSSNKVKLCMNGSDLFESLLGQTNP